MISFGSDNHSGVHPELMQCMLNENQGYAPSYGTDDRSKELKKILKSKLGAVDSHLVFNGTAANCLSLASGLKSFQSVICSDVSHLVMDECGAPEKLTGCKLIPVKSRNGKITAEKIQAQLVRKGDQHYSQAGMISITQPTELGTIYTLNEIKEISDLAKKENLFLHVDGARLCNAVHFLGTDFRTMLKGVDVLSFGGTKNGFLLGELVVFFNKELAKDFKFLRKQFLQLPSKSRFLAAPFIHYFESGLYLTIANHQHKMAKLFEASLREVCNFEITQEVQSNGVFIKFPKELLKQLRSKFFFYVWDERSYECRLMTSFDTQETDIKAFCAHLKSLL